MEILMVFGGFEYRKTKPIYLFHRRARQGRRGLNIYGANKKINKCNINFLRVRRDLCG